MIQSIKLPSKWSKRYGSIPLFEFSSKPVIPSWVKFSKFQQHIVIVLSTMNLCSFMLIFNMLSWVWCREFRKPMNLLSLALISIVWTLDWLNHFISYSLPLFRSSHLACLREYAIFLFLLLWDYMILIMVSWFHTVKNVINGRFYIKNSSTEPLND